MDDPGFTKLADVRVAIVGLGLMGGSLALALKGRCRELIGVDTDSVAQAFALNHSIVHRITDFDSALQAADLLILATPVRTLLAQLEGLTADGRRRGAQRLPCVVLDLGSTKLAIVAAMKKLPVDYDPIGGHPMCGKEIGGIAHTDPDLYQNKTFALCPLDRTSPRALGLAYELVAAVGARPLVLEAPVHDICVAWVSHLPYLAAVALMQVALAAQNETLWRMAASGFRDSSRLAASDLTMMIDILLTNRPAVLDALTHYRAELESLAGAIESGDAAALRAALESAQRTRREMFK